MSGRGSFQCGWWWIAWRRYDLSIGAPWKFGREEDWYDGPLTTISLGFLHFVITPGGSHGG